MRTNLRDVVNALPKNDKHRKAKLDFSILPGDVKISGFSGAELGRALQELKIPGASPEGSFEANKAVYENFLQGIADEGADTAVLFWFLEHQSDEQRADRWGRDAEDEN